MVTLVEGESRRSRTGLTGGGKEELEKSRMERSPPQRSSTSHVT